MGKYQIRMFLSNQWIGALQGADVLKSLTVDGLQKNYIFFAGELNKSRKESPYDFQARIRLGQLYNSWGFFDPSKLELAEQVFNEARDLSPQNPQPYWELAQTRIEQKRADEAYTLVKQAYDLYPNNPKAKAALEKIEQAMASSTIETVIGGE